MCLADGDKRDFFGSPIAALQAASDPGADTLESALEVVLNANHRQSHYQITLLRRIRRSWRQLHETRQDFEYLEGNLFQKGKSNGRKSRTCSFGSLSQLGFSPVAKRSNG
jgi:hypothetical protein